MIAAVLLAASVDAATLDYAVEAGVGRSDNIGRVATDEVSETIGTVGLELSLAQETRRMSADVNADLAYFKYFDDTYDADVIGNFDGIVDLRIIPERFDWIFQDNFGQVRSDPFAPVTPDNRENINYFTTGPNLLLHFNSQTGMRLSGQYSKVTYEVSPLDSERYSGSAAVFYQLSAASSVSLNVQTQKVEFDESAVNATGDYEQRALYARYDLKGARTQLGVDLGYTQLEQTGNDESGWLARIDLARRVSASSTFTAAFGHEFSDAGNSFRQQQGGALVSTESQSGVQSANPFTSEYVTLGWDFARQRTGFGAGVSYYDESYDQRAVLDDTRISGNVHFSRDMSTRMRLQLAATYTKNDFKNAIGDYDEIGTSAMLSQRLSQRLWLSVQYEHFDRDSDIATGEYTENRYWLRLRYGDVSVRRQPVFAERPGA